MNNYLISNLKFFLFNKKNILNSDSLDCTDCGKI